MTPPAASTLVMAGLVPLLAWRVYVRFRRARGRQRLSPYRGPITLALYAALIGAMVLANLRDPARLAAFLIALLVGGCLAAYALRRTQFEPTPSGLYYVPHGPIGMTLAVLFVARLAYRVVEVYLIDTGAPRSFAEFAHSPLTLGAFGLMAGYYAWYMLGLVRWRYRVLRAKRQREAQGGGRRDTAVAAVQSHGRTDMPATAPITEANPTVAEMEGRVARFNRLVPTSDYVDSAIPGCERTTWRVLGHRPAAPLQAEGFHMNLVRCDPGKSAPLHNHLTQEVFVALTGRWEVFWGPQGARSIVLEPLDTVTIPPGVSRGFRNIGAEPALLMGMASGQEPGFINWPPQVRAAAQAAGVTLP